VAVVVGVEEEFHVVDLESGTLVPRARSVLDRLPERGFTTELQQSIVEANSRPHQSLDDLLADIKASRRALAAAAGPLGLGVVAAGTAPMARLGTIDATADPRYRRMTENYRVVAEEQLICGLQVHVDVPDRDTGIMAMSLLSPWLPALLALSASSPFWLGSDTGYASWRTLLWQRWPTTGPAGHFRSAAHYDAVIAGLVRSGVISDAGMVYYDVRPSAHLQTLELRICDACPRAETAVMIAGLFRALVVDACDAVAEGRRGDDERLEWLRAATWRAARSGLEGDLVHPADGKPRPAPRVIRSLVTRLRPALERNGDWTDVVELTEEALGLGSAAHRVRRVAETDGLPAAVAQLVAQTRGDQGADHPPHHGGLLRGYRADHDEMVDLAGEVRPLYRPVLAKLDLAGVEGLQHAVRTRQKQQRAEGVVFRADGEDTPQIFPFDVVPRLVPAEDWAVLERGLSQRVRALEAFLHDAYGEQTSLRDGVVPAGFLPQPQAAREGALLSRPGLVRVSVAGIDLVRDAARGWLVLEDNLRVPSGIAYALAARRLTPVEPLARVAGVEDVTAVLARVLRAAAPGADPRVMVLSDGPDNSAWYEHRTLAREMGFALHTTDDLVVRDGRVHAVRPGRVSPEGGPADDRPFDVVYRRIDEDDLAKAAGADGRPLWPGLTAAARAGNVAFANAWGNGVADDKALYALVPRLIRYYLGEEPLLGQVPTLLPGEPGVLDQVLDRLAELVVKPVDGQGGAGVVIGPHASPEELARLRAELLVSPQNWVAQDVVQLTSHPTFDGERLEPRVVDLRVFVCAEREGDGLGAVGLIPTVLPLAMTRVAAGGSLIVNSSRGGGAKDTWILRGGS
jgi:carboxylate-amine ligase